MHPLLKSKARIKKQPIPKWFPEHWCKSLGWQMSWTWNRTGQSSTVRDVSKDQAWVRKAPLPALGTDEGKTTLNLRIETFERKKISWLVSLLQQHLLMCTNGLYDHLQISLTNHLLFTLSHYHLNFFLNFFTAFSLKVTFCLFQSLGLLQISRTSAEIFLDKVNVWMLTHFHWFD